MILIKFIVGVKTYMEVSSETSDNEPVHRCSTCAEHHNMPAKAPNHPWMVPEKPWSRLHLDHAINFMGTNWLVLIDAYSKYLCIHPVSSTSTKATTELLEQDFAHFGYPHTVVTDKCHFLRIRRVSGLVQRTWYHSPDGCSVSSSIKWCR